MKLTKQKIEEEQDVLVVQRFGVGLVIERLLVRLPAGVVN